MARTPLMAGNWKMNLDHLEAIFTKFEETEGDFWKALKRGPGKGTPTR